MKKRIIKLSLICILVLSLFIPQVQTLAISAMSVFRVGNARAITITIMDIEEMAAYFAEHQDLFHQLRHEYLSNQLHHEHIREHRDRIETECLNMERVHAERDSVERYMQQHQLTNISEFDGFPVRLPRELSNEAPVLMTSGANSAELTLNVAAINAILAQMRDAPLFDESLNGTTVEVYTPPVLIALYEDAGLILLATQMTHLEAPSDVQESLRGTMLAMPFLSANLRNQLAAIPIDSRDVYLPVISGFGREASIGNNTGFIYATRDLSMFFGSLFPYDPVGSLYEYDDVNASALIWTQDGVIYILAGSHSDNELVRIARSIR